jgi:hypothetical protein
LMLRGKRHELEEVAAVRMFQEKKEV